MQAHLREEVSHGNLSYSGNDNKCPYCHDTGYEYMDDGGQGVCRPCRNGCYQNIIMRSRLSFASIPEGFKDTRISDFNTGIYTSQNGRNKATMALKSIDYWLHNFDGMKKRGMGLYLHSNVKGSGKTMMAVGIANELIYEKQIQVKFATSLQILNEIKSTWDKNRNQISESKLMDFLSTTETLIIDDFGVEKFRDWIDDKLYNVINNRYNEKKITIFTSNSGLERLKYDERIINRIKERTFQIPFPEESVRDIIARNNAYEMMDGIREDD